MYIFAASNNKIIIAMRTKKNKTEKEGEVMSNDKYIRFDWAIKRILRDKANFGVLEGLMTVLIGEKITITDIIESESNRDIKAYKPIRVVMKAKALGGQVIVVELQLLQVYHYMQRILFGASKAVTEQMEIGQNYENIKKVYSINVLYFDLGSGADYVYHGKTVFTGSNHPESVLEFKQNEESFVKQNTPRIVSPDDAYPEYFLLRVNQFNEVAKTPIPKSPNLNILIIPKSPILSI